MNRNLVTGLSLTLDERSETRDRLIDFGMRRNERRQHIRGNHRSERERTLTPEQALARELAEELALLEVEGHEITRQEFTYLGKDPIELIFYRVESFAGEPENRVFHEMRWERRSALAAFDFVEGDREFLRRFAGEG